MAGGMEGGRHGMAGMAEGMEWREWREAWNGGNGGRMAGGEVHASVPPPRKILYNSTSERVPSPATCHPARMTRVRNARGYG